MRGIKVGGGKMSSFVAYVTAKAAGCMWAFYGGPFVKKFSC